MAKKKHTQPAISQEDNTQMQHVFEQYHQIVGNLHASADQEQAEVALTETNNLPEGAQLALLKALAKEQHTDAADVLIAIHKLSPLKEVRKEARRSLLRLEAERIYPQWEPPIQPTLAIQLPDTSMHFWKGIVTDSLDAGEIQLLLCFEQENDSTEIRVLGFLLEFWQDGVKDFFIRVESKQRLDNFVTQMEANMPDVKTKNCSLAEGRRLLLDALAVNKQHGTPPHKDYRANVSLVTRLVLEAPDLDEDTDQGDEEGIDLHGLNPQKVVVNFVEAWVNGNYGIAYDLLSRESAIRESLSRDEWMERRTAWADEAHPSDLEPNFLHEREPQKPRLWLPNPFSQGRSTTQKEVEVGWSIELDETSPSEALPEMPAAAVIYNETGRHWFWTSYTLVQEEDEWRIQDMIDETKNAQSLSIVELQKKVQELDNYLQEFVKKQQIAEVKQFTDTEVLQRLEEVLWRVMQATYYTDTLLKKMPLDRSLYEEAAGRMLLFAQYERSIVYLEAVTQRFGEQRGIDLRGLAGVRQQLSAKYSNKGEVERAKRQRELAEQELRASLAVQDSFEARISLAELLIDKNEQLDEAKDLLLQANALVTEPPDEAHIAMHLGEIATEQGQYQQALSHYQRVVELLPDSAESWFDLGEAHQALNNFEEAETSYKRAIELEPDNEDYYFTLSKLYTADKQPEKANEALEDGLDANPDSVALNIALATAYLDNGDYRQAEIFLEKAERIDPDVPLVQMFRQVLSLSKMSQRPSLNTPSKSGKKRRR